MEKEKQKIVIIGASISGLSLAFALKKLNKFKIIIYEQAADYTKNTNLLLWKSAIIPLLGLGLGKRLSKILTPVLKLSTTDTVTNELLLDWPPELLKDSKNTEQSNQYDHLPPMFATTKNDLIRMLLTALTGRSDLVYDTVLDFTKNGVLQNSKDVKSRSIESDLVYPDWFENEKYRELLPFIKFGHELESFRMSAQYGMSLFALIIYLYSLSNHFTRALYLSYFSN